MILISATIEKYKFDPQILSGNKMKTCLAKCDFCEDVFEKQLYYILRGRKKIEKDACTKKECINQKLSDIYALHDQTAINEKRKETNLERFGFENSFQDPQFQEKQKQTMLAKYGVEKPLQLKEFKDKQVSTMIKKHGTVSTLDASGRKEEIIQILRDKSPETIRKGAITSLKRYGVDNIAKLDETKTKREKTTLARYHVKHASELQRVSYEKIIYLCNNKNYIPLFVKEEYKTFHQLLSFKCLEHDLVFESRIENLSRDVNNCPKCKLFTVSRAQKEIFNFVNEKISNVQLSNRSVLHGKELDIYVQEKQFAIEYHGLYYHSCLHKTASFHKDRFLLCEKENIKLFQFYEDQWRDKQSICKSMILNAIGLAQKKMNARSLAVSEIEMKIGNQFLEENHLMGAYKASKNKTLKYFALTEEKDIVSCFVVRALFAKKNNHNKNSLEIVRFGTQLNTSVRGGFSKLLKHIVVWAKQQGYQKIITYSDCMYSNGAIYQKTEFNLTYKIPPNYYYTNFIDRFTKYGYRTKNGKTESEITQELGLVKIFDAGKYRWELKI